MIVTKTKGFWKLHKRFTKLQGIVGEAVDDALHQQTHRMYRKMVLNASRKDHTLDDIRRLGNPFAKRHGSIQGGMLGSISLQIYGTLCKICCSWNKSNVW